MVRYIIPARKGSKGYPYKNRRLLNYTLNTIPKKERKNVIITTDDKIIKDIAKKEGIKSTNRPPRLATDTADMKSVLMQVARRFLMDLKDIIVLLYLTYPERTWHDIEFALLYFHEKRAKSLLCKTDPSIHPYMCIYKDGRQVVEHDLYRRQDYPECFEISHYIGIFYVSELGNLNRNLYNENTVYYNIDRKLDVDYEGDLNEMGKCK